jgi:hypothetical protein
MDIVCVNSKKDVFQLVNAQGEGTQDECIMRLADLTYYEDQAAYQFHLRLGDF